MDLCFELAGQIMNRLRGHVTVVEEIHGFKYFDERDLLGFVDGTENPTGQAAYDAVTIGTGDPLFAGGSYVVVQQYLHDLDAWNALPVEAQEQAVGRTKLADIELPDDTKPSNSHVALNVITDADGTELKVLRDNMPFGRVGRGEFGTYYIAYASTPRITERMLANMFVGDPPATTTGSSTSRQRSPAPSSSCPHRIFSRHRRGSPPPHPEQPRRPVVIPM
jgi:putative iron-dependent peroxidase